MYKFQPIYKTTVWGGERIASFKGVAGEQAHVGESWELSGVAGSESVVAEGPAAGMTLPALLAQKGAALVGRKNFERFGKEFPLLVKFIDARDDLSIQVHPDDAMAARLHGKRGKTEMWYILDAEPKASLIAGFSKVITPEEYDRLIRENRITEVLASHPVQAGDCFFLPSGRVHAIGRGTLLAEIQQTSDITYRVYDYGRMGLDGKPRQLHIDEAREAIDYRLYPDYRTRYTPTDEGGVKLVECDYFTTSLYTLHNPHALDIAALDSFVILICLDGEGEIVTEQGEKCTMRRGETVLVAAEHNRIDIQPTSGGVLKLLEAHL